MYSSISQFLHVSAVFRISSTISLSLSFSSFLYFPFPPSFSFIEFLLFIIFFFYPYLISRHVFCFYILLNLLFFLPSSPSSSFMLHLFLSFCPKVGSDGIETIHCGGSNSSITVAVRGLNVGVWAKNVCEPQKNKQQTSRQPACITAVTWYTNVTRLSYSALFLPFLQLI